MDGKVRIAQVFAKCVAFGLQLLGGRALIGQLVDDLEQVRPNCAKLFDQPIRPEKEVVAIEIESFEFCRDFVGQTLNKPQPIHGSPSKYAGEDPRLDRVMTDHGDPNSRHAMVGPGGHLVGQRLSRWHGHTGAGLELELQTFGQ